MEYKQVELFWIDQYCVESTRGAEKERGMQAMDLVYGRSKYPIALLTRPLISLEEPQLPTRIGRGSLLD